jgi:hypothetical protein
MRRESWLRHLVLMASVSIVGSMGIVPQPTVMKVAEISRSQGGIGERRRGPRRRNERQGYRQGGARPGGAKKGSDPHARHQSIEKGDYQERAASAIAAAHNVRNWVSPTSVVEDSGATRHMMYDISMFEHARKIDPIRVMLGDNSSAVCSKVGTVVLKQPGGRRLRLSEVLFVPRLAIHLLSVAQLASKGIISSFEASGCILLDSEDGNSILATTSRTSDGLYVLRA